MTPADITRELFQIIDKLINLLTIQTGAEFVFEEPAEESTEDCTCCTDAVAGYAVSNTWELEDELVRDPELPDIGEPGEAE